MRRLAADGHPPVCTSRHPVEDLVEGARWIPGDLTDPAFVTRLVARVRPSVVYHLASAVTGSRSLDMVRPTLASNLSAGVNVLQAATEFACDRVILIGSGDELADGCAVLAVRRRQVGHGRVRPHVPVALPHAGHDRPHVHGLRARPARRSKLVPYTITSLLARPA